MQEVFSENIVLYIAFSGTFSWQQILAIGIINYTYKFIMAIVLTPVIYLVEKRIEHYVGHETARQMKFSAMGRESEI